MRAAVSDSVLLEARRNLNLKFPEEAQSRFESMIKDVAPETSNILREHTLPRVYEGVNL
jgi:hypothetical protein